MPRSPRPVLWQICNVGRLTGGTGACVWTVTRALPAFEHHVFVLGGADSDFSRQLAPAKVVTGVPAGTRTAAAPDIILLHNTPRAASLELPAVPTIQYLHSHISPFPADLVVCCSRWLADRCRLSADHVLYQAVPTPPKPTSGQRPVPTSGRLVVGRICTPTEQKWPASLPDFYAILATKHSAVHWEFVGCPDPLRPALREACHERCTFHDAGIPARSLLWRWDVLLYHHPTMTESFGRTVAESMRSGCVPIVDDRGGFREQIDAGSGFLCGTTSRFSTALAQLRDPARRSRFSTNAARLADQRFSLDAFARRLLNVFDEASARRSDKESLRQRHRVN